MRIIARYGHAQVGVYPVIGRSPEPVAVAAAVFGAQADTLVRERRERVYVDDPAHRVASVERRLRPPQHFDALGVGQFHVVIVLVQHRNVVDVEPHDRLVDPCPEPADVDRRGHARPVVGDVEVGDVLREVFQGVDMPPFDGAAADDGCRHGCERSTMPCLMAVTCTLSTTITVSTPAGSASPASVVASAVELSSVAGYFPNVACPAFPACPRFPRSLRLRPVLRLSPALPPRPVLPFPPVLGQPHVPPRFPLPGVAQTNASPRQPTGAAAAGVL